MLSGGGNNGHTKFFGGVFTVSGSTASNGMYDVNDDGSISTGRTFTGATLSQPADTFGRGTLTGTGIANTIAYYIVGPEAIRLIDMDSNNTLVGSAFGQGAIQRRALLRSQQGKEDPGQREDGGIQTLASKEHFRTMMETRSTPAAANPWPKVYLVAGYRLTGGNLTLEVPFLSEAPLLTALARAVHIEMRAAGEWAARIGESWGDSLPDLPGPIGFYRRRIDNAARLHAIYTALYGCGSYVNTLNVRPDVLKASVLRSYAAALRGEGARRQDQAPFPPASIEH